MLQSVMSFKRKCAKVVCVEICWSPPPFVWTRLNMDGASKKSLDAADCEGVLRDESGEWI
jgi:hypothetical protein